MTAALSGDVAALSTVTNRAGAAAYHVAALAGGGYVVMSADDESKPVVAFSDNGAFEMSAENPFYAFLDVWAERKAAAGATAKKSYADADGNSGADANRFTDEWESLAPENGGQKTTEDGETEESLSYGLSSIPDVRVAPLVKTKWGQGNSVWNYYTPNNYVCGCVATAAAQIMKYFEWPKTSVAPFTKSCFISGVSTNKTAMGGIYEWSKMLNEASSGSALESRQAMGKLAYDVGVAVQMDWGSGGSGAPGPMIAVALKSNFGYSNAIGLIRDINDSYKKNAIFASLDAQSPVSLSIEHRDSEGNATSGHAIVADGYGYDGTGTDYVHLNFGWRGSSDAWCNIPENIGTTYDYNAVDGIVFNVFTNKTGELITGRVVDEFGIPVQGASVSAELSGAVYSATTTDKGIYAITVPSGNTYSLSAAKIGYLPGESSATVGISSSANITKITATGYSFKSRGSCGNSWGNDFTLVEDDYEGPECIWTGMGGDRKFSNPSNWRGFYAPADHSGAAIVLTNCTGAVTNDIEGLSVPSITVAAGSAAEIAGKAIAATAVTNASSGRIVFSAPVTLEGDVRVSGLFDFAGGVIMRLSGDSPALTGGAIDSFAGNCVVEIAGGALSPGRYPLFASSPLPDSSRLSLANALGPNTTKAGFFSYDGETMNLRVGSSTNGWLNETAATTYLTGEWSVPQQYDAGSGIAHIENSNAFALDRPSSGDAVEVSLTVSFPCATPDSLSENIGGDSQLCLKIGTNESFRLYAADGNGSCGWVDVSAPGVTPRLDTLYTFCFTIDYAKGLYSATVAEFGGTPAPLSADGGVSRFRIANSAARSASRIDFSGSGYVRAMTGSDDSPGLPDVYAAGETAVFSDGQSVLTAAEADWLNGCGAKSFVSQVIKNKARGEVEAAYLLNLDMTSESARYEFGVTDMKTGAGGISVRVKLVRYGAIKDDEGINGRLALFGSSSPAGEYEMVSEGVTIDFKKFDPSGEAVLTFPADPAVPFLRPAIIADE